MKILKANHRDGEVLFVVEGHPNKTFVVSLKGKTTLQQVKDELKSIMPKQQTGQNSFDNLNIKSLEGTNI